MLFTKAQAFASLGLLAVMVCGLSCGEAHAEDPYVVHWAQLQGADDYDDGSNAVTVDDWGNIYISGVTHGHLDGNINPGIPRKDAFVTKYDPSGSKLWTQQIGSPEIDICHAVTTDASGNVYIGGTTEGGMDGYSNLGQEDVFLVKYDQDGNKLWTRQTGTTGDDLCQSVATDNSGNVYISGFVTGDYDGNTSNGYEDAFVTKYDSSGNKLWTRLLGSIANDGSFGLTTDASGNVYTTGYIWSIVGGLAGPNMTDAFLTKYDPSGDVVWSRQLENVSFDYSRDVKVDSSGNIYITGNTQAGYDDVPSTGDSTAFLMKYDSMGNRLWNQEIGNDGSASSFNVAVDSEGNAYITVNTNDDFDGIDIIGDSGSFVIKYDSSGNKLWSKLIDNSSGSSIGDIAIDALDNVYISGHARGSFYGNPGDWPGDAFLLKLVAYWPGDLNGDEFVGLKDLDIILNNWNQTVPTADPRADPSGDGFVSMDDLNIVLENWNTSPPPEPKAYGLPEPVSMTLLGLGGLGLVSRRVKRV